MLAPRTGGERGKGRDSEGRPEVYSRAQLSMLPKIPKGQATGAGQAAVSLSRGTSSPGDAPPAPPAGGFQS